MNVHAVAGKGASQAGESDAKTINLDVEPVQGARLHAIMDALQRMPKVVSQRAKKYFE